MNAHALLTSQGWRGTGHSLHPTSDTTGLSKPLLVSQKQNNLGIGKKQHRTSDMWWMNAFDSSLKGLDTSKAGVVVQTVTSGGLDMVARGGGKFVGKKGLYASFVRGECLSGTLTPEEEERESGVDATAAAATAGQGKRKREKREVKESKEVRSARKLARRMEKAGEDFAVKEPEAQVATETKEQRRARKAAKRASKTQDASPEVEEVEKAQSAIPETKDQRKERKRLKKLAQESEKKEVEVPSEEPKKKKRRKE